MTERLTEGNRKETRLEANGIQMWDLGNIQSRDRRSPGENAIGSGKGRFEEGDLKGEKAFSLAFHGQRSKRELGFS